MITGKRRFPSSNMVEPERIIIVGSGNFRSTCAVSCEIYPYWATFTAFVKASFLLLSPNGLCIRKYNGSLLIKPLHNCSGFHFYP
jgi:hypothetical protein